MIDLDRTFDCRVITQEQTENSLGLSDYEGLLGYGLEFSEEAEGVIDGVAGRLVARQACVMPINDVPRELKTLVIPPRCSPNQAVRVLERFLQTGAVVPIARIALRMLIDAIKRGDLVLGDNVLAGNECNRGPLAATA